MENMFFLIDFDFLSLESTFQADGSTALATPPGRKRPAPSPQSSQPSKAGKSNPLALMDAATPASAEPAQGVGNEDVEDPYPWWDEVGDHDWWHGGFDDWWNGYEDYDQQQQTVGKTPKVTPKGPKDKKEDDELTQGAKLNRLRRLCEKKPSGKIAVPEEIHKKYMLGGAERQSLLEELESSGWDKATGFAKVFYITHAVPFTYFEN